jgi:hypothetical protein
MLCGALSLCHDGDFDMGYKIINEVVGQLRAKMNYRSDAYSCPLDEARQHWLDYLDSPDSIDIEMCAQFTVDAINETYGSGISDWPSRYGDHGNIKG